MAPYSLSTRNRAKSGSVHIWLRIGNGDLMFINNINERVARFLMGQAAE
jgi:hypothetical protein